GRARGGPALGLLREAEERTAVAKAGVREVFNLDDVDFYYTVSAPLTDTVWGGDTLEKVVRIVRQTRPEILLTMDPRALSRQPRQPPAGGAAGRRGLLRGGRPRGLPRADRP
ncbi:hypothetical protein, partial [Nonomuraea dietziae]|uniref:hypothetical protein n=1 Tax=Nonomuraea dietziae TaxID=65515 RepID=UPI0031D5058A